MKPPALNIPDSRHTVEVLIIDSTSYAFNIPSTAFMEPQIPGFRMATAPCYSFLIKRNNPEQKSKYDNLIFDLGIRKDWENGPPINVKLAKEFGFKVSVEKGVADVLQDGGQELDSIGGIVWSHWHWDHTGDPSTFPKTTDLIVGPGFKDAFLPGYPLKEDCPVAASAWEGRNLREIDFARESSDLRIGRYRALDFHGDGSFYLLDSPGHAIGHLCGLARTSTDPAQFIFMGGDIAHYCGEFRPTQYLPLPKQISPNPLYPVFSKEIPSCPGAIFEALHPNKSSTEPFFHPSQGEKSIHHDPAECQESVNKLMEFDVDENMFSVIAHDQSLYDVISFFPKGANEWKKKGWKIEGRWRFLKDFDTGSDEGKPPK